MATSALAVGVNGVAIEYRTVLVQTYEDKKDAKAETPYAFKVEKKGDGTGEVCPTNATASVNYTGKLAKTGKIFDSSNFYGRPTEFMIGTG